MRTLFKTGLFLFLGLLPARISEACGPYPVRFYGYSFINPTILNDEAKAAPYFLNFEKIYAFYKPEEIQKVQDNLTEWAERFCQLVPIKDLEYIIYKASISDLELLATAVKSPKMPIPLSLSSNEFADYVKSQKCLETVEYLIFAKKCEPYVVAPDPWNKENRNEGAMRQLIKEGLKAFKKTESPYMKLRYAFQIIRLAHYVKDYEYTLQLYDDLMPKIDRQVSRMDESLLYWWILGHKAGALRALGQNVKASYLYSLIFEHCPSRRESAFRSFYIRTDEEWHQCELLCQSDDERVTLYALRAHASESKAIEEMEKIYEIRPQSPHLEVLLVQEIKRMEKNLLGVEFNVRRKENRKYFNIPKPYVERYIVRLHEFAKKCADEKRVRRPELWRIAQGYLLFLAGNDHQAGIVFEGVKNQIGDPALLDQLEAFELAWKIGSLRKIDEAAETEIYHVILDNKTYRKYRSFPGFLRDKLTQLYANAGHPGKAFLCQYPLKKLKPNPQEEIIQDLLQTLRSDTIVTPFERLLTEDEKGMPITNKLLDMQAVIFMQKYQWEAALRVFKDIPREQWDDFGVFMPFRETLNDCVHCLYRRDTLEMYNRGELLEALLDLQSKALGRLDQSAKYYYQIGLGLYNMSYFGHSWQAMDYFRSGSTWSRMFRQKSNVFSYPDFPFGNIEHLDVSRALYYFEKARQAAPEGSEIGARATFMAAKCEQKMYFLSEDYRPSCRNCIPQTPPGYLTNFKRLKEQYAETDYYRKVIRECKYFEAYTRH